MRMDYIDLLAMMPRFMREDETTQALCRAIQPELQNLNFEALQFLYSLLIDNAPEWLLDEMAWEENIQWYDKSASIEAKRRIIRNAPWIKAHLGTKAAVETTVADYFDEATVEEWFDYDADPFMFRVTTGSGASDEHAYRFLNAVRHTKNVRSHLDELIIETLATQTLYTAAIYTEDEEQRVTIPGLEATI